jgi:hypothetical protein
LAEKSDLCFEQDHRFEGVVSDQLQLSNKGKQSIKLFKNVDVHVQQMEYSNEHGQANFTTPARHALELS